MHKIAVATKNVFKTEEIKKMLQLDNIEILSMSDLNIDIDIVENGTSFGENALIKAETLYKYINDENIMVIADDSGLSVDALSGAPGIYSARYSGGKDKDNNNKLIEELKDVPLADRTAHFTCVIALVGNNIKETFTGTCDGIIGFEEKGNNKFGYDPLFVWQATGQTFGEMDKEEKNKISHRANAISKLKKYLEGM